MSHETHSALFAARQDHEPTAGIDAPRFDVAPVETLASLAGEWNSLAGDRPFSAYQWLAPWWEHFGAGQKLYTLAVRNSARELVAIAPWRIERSATQGRVIRFLGSGAVCSDYLSLPCRAGYEAAAPAAIGHWLAGPAAGTWDLLELTGVRAGEPAVARLVETLAARGHRVQQRPDASCWRIALPPTWERFLDGLSASRRQRTRTLLRRALDNGRARLVPVTSAARLERGFRVLVDLHTRRRLSLGQPGCFADPAFTAFLRDAAERLLAAGRLRMFWLEAGERPIAVEFSLLGGETVHYYQGGFDPDLAAERPGWLCFAASIRAAIADGYRGYDFLRGDEAYKASWGAEPIAMLEIRVAARRPLAQLRLSAWSAQAMFKRAARRCEQAGLRRWERWRRGPAAPVGAAP